MSAHKLIDGKTAATRVLLQVREDVMHLREQDIEPALAVILEAIAPVPGGVGPMTLAFLMKNTVTAALAHHHALRSRSEAVCHSIF